MEWKPIETAPKSGEFIAFGSYSYPHDKTRTEYIMIVERTGLADWPFESLEGQHALGSFSHWMPLPSPPVTP